MQLISCKSNSTFYTVSFRVFDAGGQKAQRRKWIHYFDNIDALIFVIAISEYNQFLCEDTVSVRILAAFKKS
jgi:hypothetical protein